MKYFNQSELLSKLDIFGNHIGLHIFKESTYHSITSICFSLSTIIVSIVVTSVIWSDFFNTNNPKLVYNVDSEITPVNNLTDIPIAVQMSYINGTPIPPEKNFYYEGMIMEWKKININNQWTVNLTTTYFSLKKCDKKNDLGNYSDLFGKFNLTNSYCIPANSFNRSVWGRFGDTKNGWSMLGIFVNLCDPSVSECLDSSLSENLLSNPVLSMEFVNNQVNNYNYSHPVGKKLQTVTFTLSNKLHKGYHINIRKNIYDTDQGWIFEEHYQQEFYTYDGYSMDVNLKNDWLPTHGLNLGYVLFQNSESNLLSYRSFTKVQDCLASIQGFIGTLSLFVKIISDFLTRRIAYLNLINHLAKREVGISSYSYSADVIKQVIINTGITGNGKNTEKNFQILSLDQTKSKKVNYVRKDYRNMNNMAISSNSNDANAISNKIFENMYKSINYKWFEYIQPKCCFSKRNKAELLFKISKLSIIEKISVEKIVENFMLLKKFESYIINEINEKTCKKYSFENQKTLIRNKPNFLKSNNEISLIDQSSRTFNQHDK